MNGINFAHNKYSQEKIGPYVCHFKYKYLGEARGGGGGGGRGGSRISNKGVHHAVVCVNFSSSPQPCRHGYSIKVDGIMIIINKHEDLVVVELILSMIPPSNLARGLETSPGLKIPLANCISPITTRNHAI